ncbi:hypothetical protein Ddye_016259 [Dipteronia dyeriana]|uniref:Uncharacterized protein n=1 Tax=Dipteronia dyeriana TaxID=168575 RepID=A0AAD9U6F5_9ROSI|nr:hypothetical protein Ddye_016259 [Dipteronia dyeriana]
MAFVQNRHLVDSFVIANEIIYWWKRDKEGVEVLNCLFLKASDSDLLKGVKFGLDRELVMQKIRNRLAPWKLRFFSKSGRLVLIKAVLWNIPTYFMSLVKMPTGVAQKIERLQMEFFWGDGIEKHKIHTVNWATVCMRKSNSGLRISPILDKNAGLLAKWVWRFGCEEHSLWKKVEVFVWNLSKGKTLVKDVLHKLRTVKTSNLNSIVWTIWESRNQSIFNNKEKTVECALDMIKFRVGWWFKYYGNGSQHSVTNIMLNLKDLCKDKDVIKRSIITNWSPPSVNGLKFNVDWIEDSNSAEIIGIHRVSEYAPLGLSSSGKKSALLVIRRQRCHE